MTSQDWVAIIGAIAAGVVAILTALGVVYGQVRRTHDIVNSRMTELLNLTRTSAEAKGRLHSKRADIDADGPMVG